MSDLKREISSKYYVLTRDGVALRGLFIIDKEVRPQPAGQACADLRLPCQTTQPSDQPV